MATSTESATRADAPPPAVRRRRTPRVDLLLVAAVALMVLGSLLARAINTDGGDVSVKEVAIFGADGHEISAYVYMPKSATPQSPAPAIAMWHGLNNQKEYMSNTALEFARRGFVVVAADQTGHGSSNGANQDVGCGGPDTLAYLSKLGGVDPTRIGLVGMSQGGFCAATAAAMAQPDAYRSIFYMESEPNPPGVPDATPWLGLHNVAYNIGRWTELPGMIMVNRGDDAKVSPQLMQMFDTKEPIVVDKVYGSIEDGTGRILYNPYEGHAASTDSTAAIGNAVDWMQQTLGVEGLDKSNQIWPWKLVGTTAALLGAYLFLFAMGRVLLRRPAFASLSRSLPEYRGLSGASWWIGALITTAVGPLLYLWVWKHMFFDPWVSVSTLWPQTFTNVYMVWAVIVGVVSIALMVLNHVAITRKQGGNLASYGLAEPDGRIDWRGVGRAALLVGAVLVPLYLILAVIQSTWHVDFRAWVVTLMPMNLARFSVLANYAVPFAVFFIAQGVSFAGFLRYRSGRAALWVEMVVNSVVLTLGALVWVLIFYIPLFRGDTNVFGTDPTTATASGMGGIYYLPLLVLWPLSACLYTYYYRKTGRIFVGSFMVTAFMVWTMVAAADFGVWPIIG